MRRVRQHLSCVIGVWLVCQLAGLAGAPLSAVGVIANAVQRCTCPPGAAPDAACPMHHSAARGRECVLKSASSAGDAALLSLMGTLGLMPPSQATVAVAVAVRAVPSLYTSTIARSDRPESPPPRA